LFVECLDVMENEREIPNAGPGDARENTRGDAGQKIQDNRPYRLSQGEPESAQGKRGGEGTGLKEKGLGVPDHGSSTERTRSIWGEKESEGTKRVTPSETKKQREPVGLLKRGD